MRSRPEPSPKDPSLSAPPCSEPTLPARDRHRARQALVDAGIEGLRRAQHATGRGVCPICSRALVCESYAPPTSWWRCSGKGCAFRVERAKASRLYRLARLQYGDRPLDGGIWLGVPKEGDTQRIGRERGCTSPTGC